MTSKVVEGSRFGEWTVLRFTHRDHLRASRWYCRCSCGRESVVRQSELACGRSTRCKRCSNRIQRNRRAERTPEQARKDFAPGRHIPDAPACPACGLRGEHVCVRGDATRGMGSWGGMSW